MFSGWRSAFTCPRYASQLPAMLVLVAALAPSCVSWAPASTEGSIAGRRTPSERLGAFDLWPLSPAAPLPRPPHFDGDLARAGVLAEGAEGSGEVTFTFDDGPGGGTTTEVLRVLAAHGVRGAFFLTGSRLAGSGLVPEMNRHLARAIVEAGHVVGNHGLDHAALGDDASAVSVQYQIEDSAERIAAATGVMPRYFRPPYGVLGSSGRDVLLARRDELVMWSIDAQDVAEVDPKHLARRLISQLVFAGQGIVLLHDLRPSSVQALSLVLDWLDAHPRRAHVRRGYQVVDLPTFLAHAGAHPFPVRSRAELYRARLRKHRGNGEPLASSHGSEKGH